MQANGPAAARLDVAPVLVLLAANIAVLAGSAAAAVSTHEPTERGDGDAVLSDLDFS